jgi:hypothetical protein
MKSPLLQSELRRHFSHRPSINDVTHTLHCLLKMLENMQLLDAERGSVDESAADDGEP